MYTLVLAPLVHALIMNAVQMVKEGGKPPFVPRSREAKVPESEAGSKAESEAGSYEKSRTEKRGDSVAAVKERKANQRHANSIFFIPQIFTSTDQYFKEVVNETGVAVTVY